MGVQDCGLTLHECNSDDALFKIALVAQLNGKTDWLSTIIQSDSKSPFTWRRKRAIVLNGFKIGNAPCGIDEWPSGAELTGNGSLERRATRYRNREAFAKYWWDAYWNSTSAAEANAAWVVFLHSADSRAYAFMSETMQQPTSDSMLSRLRRTHFRGNRNSLLRAIKKHMEKLDRKFLDRSIDDGVGPWRKGYRE